MKKQRLISTQIPDYVVTNVVNRDAVLWIGSGFNDSEEINALCELAQLPWRSVLCESDQPAFVDAIKAVSQAPVDDLTRARGFIHVIAANPEGLVLPPRSLPVLLLNGLAGAADQSESNRPGMASMLRRLNMLNTVIAAKPKLLVIASKNDSAIYTSFRDIWNDGFRSLVTVVSTSKEDGQRLDAWLAEANSPAAVDYCELPISRYSVELARRVRESVSSDRIVLRVRTESGTAETDITKCELPEQPILDRYDVITTSMLRLLQPDELTQQQLTGFFDRSLYSWAPYAAGVPWERTSEPREKVIDALRRVAQKGPDENCILCIASESGAGGTTLGRMIAFAAASEGFPTIAARPVKFNPEPTELASFFYRVRQQLVSASPDGAVRLPDDESDVPEVPWLIVFDVQHWDGRQAELRHFVSDISRSRRPLVVLCVIGTDVSEELRGSARYKLIHHLDHELTTSEALALGTHLNRFLKPFGQDKSDSDWQRFFEAHRPSISKIASFWIALEFWLKGQIDISGSIQGWLYKQFDGLDVKDALRLLLLEIAALSTERQPLPEGLMPAIESECLPNSILLEQIRSSAPALALVREGSATTRQWAMAHDLLGRYLIASLFADYPQRSRLTLGDATDPVQLRLALIRRVATRPDIARKPFIDLAVEFAVKILKLDFGGNSEFFRYWREVVDILKSMPQSIRDGNRTFNHHVAISCRRVVKMREYFDPSAAEERDLLTYAIGRLEYALTLPSSADDEESDLNLFNSLALAYQDLAEVEQQSGADEKRVRELRTKAETAARNAHDAGPSNPYVLETMARNILQNGELYREQAVQSGCEALGLLYQAMSLDRSEFRQIQLSGLANRALRLLRQSHAASQIEDLCRLGNPLGYLAKAWMSLAQGAEQLDQDRLERFPVDRLQAALNILNQSNDATNWLLLQFKYDLIAAANPYDFESQLGILDELELGGYRMSLQLRLERAILLHQRHRSHDANLAFQSLRRDLRQFDLIVTVPTRLQWLLTDDAKRRRLCDAVVMSDSGYRAVAKVRDLKDAVTPFIPQEFHKSRMGPREAFKCHITFGPKGPFIKPPVQHEVDGDKA